MRLRTATPQKKPNRGGEFTGDSRENRPWGQKREAATASSFIERATDNISVAASATKQFMFMMENTNHPTYFLAVGRVGPGRRRTREVSVRLSSSNHPRKFRLVQESVAFTTNRTGRTSRWADRSQFLHNGSVSAMGLSRGGGFRRHSSRGSDRNRPRRCHSRPHLPRRVLRGTIPRQRGSVNID